MTEELQLPEGLPQPPPPPEGHKWVYRGKGWRHEGENAAAVILGTGDEWGVSEPHDFAGFQSAYYLEAVLLKSPRPHAELIHAWADGAEIEFFRNEDGWKKIEWPSFIPEQQYRIAQPEKPKPEKRPLTPEFFEGHPAIWMRGQSGGEEILVVGMSRKHVIFREAFHMPWKNLIEGWQYSIDGRKTFHPCYQ